MKANQWICCGAVLAALAVGTGALGAHGLETRLKMGGVTPKDVVRRLEVHETAVRYHMYHALGLILVGLISARANGAGPPSKVLTASAGLLLAGVLMFSGGLYVFVYTGVSLPWFIVPAGGVAFIAGWVALAAGTLWTPRIGVGAPY